MRVGGVLVSCQRPCQAQRTETSPSEPQVPEAAIVRAFRDRCGGLAWQKEDVVEVARLLARAEIAILGGDVWITGTKDGEPVWSASFPLAEPEEVVAEGICVWSTEPEFSPDLETWDEYCLRGADQAVEKVLGFDPEYVAPRFRRTVRYNLCYLDSRGYDSLTMK